MSCPCQTKSSYTFRFYSTILFRFVILSIAVEGSRGNLQNRWSLPDNPTSFEYQNFQFLLEFPVSRDVATENNIAVSLFDRGCKYNDGEPPVELIRGTSEELVFPASISSSTAPTVMTGAKVTLGGDEMNVGSLLQEYPSLWNNEKTQLTFCVRFSLVTENIEVNFVETVVILDVKMDGLGFQVDKANVAPKEKIESIQQVSYSVKAYLCDGHYRPLFEENTGLVDLLHEVCDPETGAMKPVSRSSETDSTFTEGKTYKQELSEAQKEEREKIIYRQGSVVRVCIRPDDTDLGEVSMGTIEEMVFEGTIDPDIGKKMHASGPTTFVDAEKGTYTQVAVQNGSTITSNGLSTMSCENNRLEGRSDVLVCAIDTLLVADFYWRQPGNVATVAAYGNAVLQFRTSKTDVTQNIGKRLRRAEVVGDKALPDELQRLLQSSRPPLDTYWNMTRPKVDLPDIGQAMGLFNFRLNYTVSDAISNDMIQLEIWDKDCEDRGKEPEVEYSADKQTSSDLLEVNSTDAYETGEGWGSQTITVNGRWKREKSDFGSMLAGSPFYHETSDGSLVQISLCARYQLHTKPEIGGTEVNFLETPVIINIDMSAEISFGVNLELISDQDECLEELDQKIKTLSGGDGGVDDLFFSDLYWSPSAQSLDPNMPMGPSTFRYSSQLSSSYFYDASNPEYSTEAYRREEYNRFYNQRNGGIRSGASAITSRNSWIITTTIGIGTFAFFFHWWI